MAGIDPRILALFCLFFIGLGIYNIYNGRKRLLKAQAQGESLQWYRQVGILTGIEYILLSLAFLLSISITYHFVPPSWGGLIVPLYLLILISAVILASIVVYQSVRSSRRYRGRTETRSTPRRETPSVQRSDDQEEQREMTREQQELALKRRRERRQKAAAARRRRAGKA